MFFVPGKLYEQKKYSRFPNENGLRNSHFYKPGENIDNPFNIKDGDNMLVLEVYYTQRYKMTTKVGTHYLITIYMWNMKVLINDQVGYVSQWEDQWEEVH